MLMSSQHLRNHVQQRIRMATEDNQNLITPNSWTNLYNHIKNPEQNGQQRQMMPAQPNLIQQTPPSGGQFTLQN